MNHKPGCIYAANGVGGMYHRVPIDCVTAEDQTLTPEKVGLVLGELVTDHLEHWRIVHIGAVIPQSGGDKVRVNVIFEVDR